MNEHYQQFLERLRADDRVPDLRQRAYILATVKHETADTFRPIAERFNGDPQEYFTKKYEHRKDLGNTRKGDGYLFRGRGYVQITGRANYRRFAPLLGVALEAQPDLALQDGIAYQICILGMRDGLFTGKKLADYINNIRADYLNARRIVNAMDKAATIAEYALEYERTLVGAAA